MIGSEPITWNQFDIFDLNRGRVEPEAESVLKIPRMIGSVQRNGKNVSNGQNTNTGDQWP